MNLHEHFLEKDLAQASRHHKCVKDCLKLLTEHIQDGEVDKARERSIDLLLSLQIMSNMAFEKRHMERVKNMIPGMATVLSVEIGRYMPDEETNI